jgi:hypothetical protein
MAYLDYKICSQNHPHRPHYWSRRENRIDIHGFIASYYCQGHKHDLVYATSTRSLLIFICAGCGKSFWYKRRGVKKMLLKGAPMHHRYLKKTEGRRT